MGVAGDGYPYRGTNVFCRLEISFSSKVETNVETILVLEIYAFEMWFFLKQKCPFLKTLIVNVLT